MPRVFRLLPQKLRLHVEDVIEHAVDAPALQAVLGDDAGPFEMLAQRNAEGAIDPDLPAYLRLLEKLEASIEGELLRPVRGQVHSVPSTSTRPAAVTCTYTLLSGAR